MPTLVKENTDGFARVFGHYRGFAEILGEPANPFAQLPETIFRFRRKDIDGTFRTIVITPTEIAISIDYGRGRDLKCARVEIAPEHIRHVLAYPLSDSYNDVDLGNGMSTRLWFIGRGRGEIRFGVGISTPDAVDSERSDGSCYVWLRARDRDEILWQIRDYQPPALIVPEIRLHLQSPT
jgi:hypothetical protein